jgi:hypothetical protein
MLYYGTTSGSYSNGVDVGNQTQYQLTTLASGTTYYFVVRAYAGSLSSGNSDQISVLTAGTAAAAPPPVNNPPVNNPTSDLGFAGDGRASVLWQRTDGTLQAWLLNGVASSQTATFSPSTTGSTMEVVATADFNSDDRPDLLLQHRTTGALSLWYMNGTTRSSTASVSPAAPVDTNYRVIAAADFDNNGTVDLLWQHRVTGVMAVWYMNSGSRTMASAALVNPAAPVDTNWHVAAVADLNGDNRVDLVWQHAVTGGLAVWYMRGHQLASPDLVSPAGPADPNWKLVAARDLNGDNRPDFIFQHAVDHGVVTWYMNNRTLAGASWFTPNGNADLRWTVEGDK